ncbi:MAG: Gfo/Idh/MocA family oxidoreductase [Verrucomicrobia bacterium]|nr:Gfo/Idh/MocA family oxidoreductase [Verrucomicrobiota bacterium]
MTKQRGSISRRGFLKATAAVIGAPQVISFPLLGANAPGNRITIGCIGVGRMGTGDLVDIMGRTEAQVVAVCDLDSKRLENARQAVEKRYAAGSQSGSWKGCAAYGDFRELIARPDIDAVQIVTPDHWHAIPAIAAARAGKDVFLQKPLTYSLVEGRILSDTVRRFGRILQVGSQHRSNSRIRFGCELVRNGRIGKLRTVKVCLPTDPPGPVRTATPPPPELNYDMWLGPAPWADYIEDRVHPRNNLDRPGWLRVSDYCLGMITGWGAHYLDVAQWGMGTELTGPVEVEGKATYPAEGVWDVHGSFRIEYTYANGVKLICGDLKEMKLGILFEGSEGWVFVDPGRIDAEPKSLLTSTIKPGEIHLCESKHHKQNFLNAVRSRTDPIAPVEVAHRSCSVCIIGHIAMKTGRKLKWDPAREQFTNDDSANRMLSRTARGEWQV